MAASQRWVVRAVLGLAVALPLAGVVMYAVNPFGVRSLDPRQRIIGYGLYRVPASNMEPTFVPDQVLLTRAGHYVRHAPQRGDVVTLLIPQHEGQVWLQRVIGLPGETIAIEAGIVHVDGKPLEEPYVSADNVQMDYSLTMPATRIAEGHYFMLGDHRDNSMDSRWQTQTLREDITGKVLRSLN